MVTRVQQIGQQDINVYWSGEERDIVKVFTCKFQGPIFKRFTITQINGREASWDGLLCRGAVTVSCET